MLPALPAIEPSRALLKSRDAIYVGAPHPGNVASLTWYIDKVVPQYEKHPQLTLVGRISEARNEYLTMPRPVLARNHRPVPDLARYYPSAELAICPTMQGRGISVKTIEAFAAGLPVVGTSLAFRGMPKKDMARLPDFDDPAAFAAEVTRLIAQQSLAERKSSELALYEKLFTPKHSLEVFSRHFARSEVARLQPIPILSNLRNGCRHDPGIDDVEQTALHRYDGRIILDARSPLDG